MSAPPSRTARLTVTARPAPRHRRTPLLARAPPVSKPLTISHTANTVSLTAIGAASAACHTTERSSFEGPHPCIGQSQSLVAPPDHGEQQRPDAEHRQRQERPGHHAALLGGRGGQRPRILDRQHHRAVDNGRDGADDEERTHGPGDDLVGHRGRLTP